MIAGAKSWPDRAQGIWKEVARLDSKKNHYPHITQEWARVDLRVLEGNSQVLLDYLELRFLQKVLDLGQL